MAGEQLLRAGERRRRAILGFIRGYVAEHGYAPTIHEIAQGVALASPNGTRQHLFRLRDEGYLRLTPRAARAIALVDPAPDGWTARIGS